jgi:hypothetical protein
MTPDNTTDIGQVYRERNLAALAFLRSLWTAGLTGRVMGWWDDDETGKEWAVVWVILPPDKQVGWHVPVEMIPDWLPENDPEYDGYSTAERQRRLEVSMYGRDDWDD